MPDGILIINKPSDWTSFDVVAKIRNKLGIKKIGHTGTLDPMATGVLVLCLGKATKLAQKITDTDKEYVAEVTFGATSTTDDAEGEVTPFSSAVKELTLDEIKTALAAFQGTILQLPPDFSAKKIGGKRAYKIARKGEKPKLEPREITINEIKILDYKWPKLSLRIDCSKGTYIRSIARDLGEKLNVGGYLTGLIRTKVGKFTLNQAITIEEADEGKIIPLSNEPFASGKPC